MKISNTNVLFIAAMMSTGTVLSQAQFVRSGSSCPTGSQALEFRFFTDNRSWLENGWTLNCEDAEGNMETVWDVPTGTLKYEATTQVFQESTCVPDTTSCFLTIYDTAGDGLMSAHEADGFTGWFVLIHGATTVAVYTNEPDPYFAELDYCVGPACDKPPQEVTGNSSCETVYLALQFDARPEDTTYTLVCDDELVWEGKDFARPGQYLEEESCIPTNSCCTFTVNDADSQGLTAPHNDNMGFIYLEYKFDGLLEYDGITGEEFHTKSVQFGSGCSNPWQDEVNVPVEDIENSGPDTVGDGSAVERPIPEQPEDFDLTATSSKSLEDGAKVALFTIAGLCIFAALVVGLFYRNTLLRQKQSEGISSSSGFKKEALGSKDEQAKQHEENVTGLV